VHERAPDAHVSRVEMLPVGGTLLLAARTCGRADAIPAEQLTELIERALVAEAR
jgi:hypothetical protein